MHRRGGEEDDLLAISPPPEFQDIPAPPPTVFRDLSPSPSTPRSVGGNSKIRAHYHHLSEFAARISFDILNEAMVIATEKVLSHGGCNVRCGSSTADTIIKTRHVHTSGSSEEETSITTSWEYLPKPCSTSKSANELRVRRSPFQTNPIDATELKHCPKTLTVEIEIDTHRNPTSSFCGDESKSNDLPIIKRSASFQSNNGNDASIISTVNSTSIPNHSSSNNQRSNIGSCVNRHSIAGTSNICVNVQNENIDTDLCYDAAFKNDIYSLPVDDISANELLPTTVASSSSNPIIFGPRRSWSNNGLLSNHITLCNEDVICGWSNPSSTFQQSKWSANNGDLLEPESVKVAAVCVEFDGARSATDEDTAATNFTINKPGHEDPAEEFFETASTRSIKSRNPPRRSHSVEVNISNVDSYHLDTSQLDINSKQRSPLEGGSTSTKHEKRTIGHSILNLFRRKSRSKPRLRDADDGSQHYGSGGSSFVATTSRALPLPPPPPAIVSDSSDTEVEPSVRISCGGDTNFPTHIDLGPWSDDESLDTPVEAKDFTISIEKVKDCGWYWGPLSSEAAEDLLRGEPDGSFIVRDSSDAHYIFSLTFKLNGLVRHVRIEHDQGNFSFGPLTRFKGTIVDFVEKAVAHSRSGRYLFFLHRRPILGPMRVQLLHPYSRFKHPRSLQHMCRFVILKYVRRDLIPSLPLPKPLQEYLNTPHYYFEKHEDRKAC